MLFKLVQRIREEFEEAPGLRVTRGEAARFWGLDEETCDRVLATLLATGFLAIDCDGRYGEVVAAPDIFASGPSGSRNIGIL
jgi:hypothetical protein